MKSATESRYISRKLNLCEQPRRGRPKKVKPICSVCASDWVPITQGRCRECMRIRSREYYKNNKEKHRESVLKWRAKNIDRHREAQKRWNLKNSEKRMEATKRWAAKNPDKIKAITRRANSKRRYGEYGQAHQLFLELKRAMKNKET